VTKYRKATPPHVAAALGHALEKLPADRFATAAEFATALKTPGASATWTTAGAPARASARRVSVRERVAWSVAAAMTLTVVALGLKKPREVEEPVLRVPIDLPGARLYSSTASTLAISPQGDAVVFLAQTGSSGKLMIRRTGDLMPRELVGTGVSAQPAFSSDGRWVVYAEGSRIFKVQVDGSASIQLGVLTNTAIRGFQWMGNDSILIGADRGLLILPSKGGVPHFVAGVDTMQSAWLPALLPDGKTVAYTIGAGLPARRVVVTNLTTRKTTTLELTAAMALGMRDRHLLWISPIGEIFGAPFDLDKHEFTGDPVQLEAGVRLSANGSPFAALSRSGSLWFASGQMSYHLVRVSGSMERPVFQVPRAFRAPRLSPNGRVIAVAVSGTAGTDVWLYDHANETFQPLTTDGRSDFPEWSSDGKRVLYRSSVTSPASVQWKPADGSGTAERLYQPEHAFNEAVLSPDSKWLVYRTAPGPLNRDIFAAPLSGDGKPVLLAGGPNYESHARVSPNGKWLAYQSDEGGAFQVYVRPFPGAGARVQVSNQGATEPIWSRSGSALYYRGADGRVEMAQVSEGPPFSVGARRVVMATPGYELDLTHHSWDVFPDGNSFLMVKAVAGDADRPILVHNWGRAVREKLRGNPR